MDTKYQKVFFPNDISQTECFLSVKIRAWPLMTNSSISLSRIVCSFINLVAHFRIMNGKRIENDQKVFLITIHKYELDR